MFSKVEAVSERRERRTGGRGVEVEKISRERKKDLVAVTCNLTPAQKKRNGNKSMRRKGLRSHACS